MRLTNCCALRSTARSSPLIASSRNKAWSEVVSVSVLKACQGRGRVPKTPFFHRPADDRIIHAQVLLRHCDGFIPQHLLESENIVPLVIDMLCERFSYRVCRDLVIQACCVECLFESFVCSGSVNCTGGLSLWG